MGALSFGGDLRSQPVDCPVGSSSPNCPGTTDAGPGGYTFGDFGLIGGGPEVHADGEIWLETLWDLRRDLGRNATEELVTRGMELSPPSPSFLDMRNAILQADVVANGGANEAAIWNVFADRGMGYFASSLGGGDVYPVEDFATPARLRRRHLQHGERHRDRQGDRRPGRGRHRGDRRTGLGLRERACPTSPRPTARTASRTCRSTTPTPP